MVLSGVQGEVACWWKGGGYDGQGKEEVRRALPAASRNRDTLFKHSEGTSRRAHEQLPTLVGVNSW